MSGVIYGNKTINGIEINDMTFHNTDYVFRKPEFPNFFVRVTHYCNSTTSKMPEGPALALFSDEKINKKVDEFYAIYAKKLEGEDEDYIDEFGRPANISEEEVDKFWEEVKEHREAIEDFLDAERKAEELE